MIIYLLAVAVLSGKDGDSSSLFVVVSDGLEVLLSEEVVVFGDVGHEDVPVVFEVGGKGSVVEGGGEVLVSDTRG